MFSISPSPLRENPYPQTPPADPVGHFRARSVSRAAPYGPGGADANLADSSRGRKIRVAFFLYPYCVNNIYPPSTTSRFISFNSSTRLKTYPSTSTAASISPPAPNRAHHS